MEEKSIKLDTMTEELASVQKAVEELTDENNHVQSRLTELEDRSRRDNLIFHGVPDSRETWQETEAKLTNSISAILDSFSSESFQRVHRLGNPSPTKCRPIVAKFTDFKTKEKVLSLRNQLKDKNISVSEDFSVATRQARKKLIDFGKAQAGSSPLKLRYNKLLLNNKCYMYFPECDKVLEVKKRTNYVNNARASSSVNTTT